MTTDVLVRLWPWGCGGFGVGGSLLLTFITYMYLINIILSLFTFNDINLKLIINMW